MLEHRELVTSVHIASVAVQTQEEELRADVSASDHYVVHLPLYEGPIHLLLHLIEKRQMEITTISLVAVTCQYLEYLRHYELQESLPLAAMSEFVAVAARLLFIKSQSLLPQTAREQEEAGVESAVTMAEELQRHLIEYKVARDVAHHLHERVEAGLQSHGRSSVVAGIEEHLAWTPPRLTGMDAQILARTFQRLLELKAKDEAHGSELMPIARVRVSERISEIRSRLEEASVVLLSDVLEQETSRLVMIVTFIAILELWKWQRVDVIQESLMGPIALTHGALWHETWQELVDD